MVEESVADDATGNIFDKSDDLIYIQLDSFNYKYF